MGADGLLSALQGPSHQSSLFGKHHQKDLKKFVLGLLRDLQGPKVPKHGPKAAGHDGHGPKAARHGGHEHGHGRRVDGDRLSTDAGRRTERAFEAITYRARENQISFSQGITSRSGGVSGTEPSVTRQLEFDFFASVRVEEVTRFQASVAQTGDGLKGTQRETLVQASRRIAARFEFSLSISGEALQGFADAAEGLSGGLDLDRLFELTEKLLSEVDDIFNEAFALLGGTSKTGDDLQTRIDAILKSLTEGLFSGATHGQEGGGGAVTFEIDIQLEFSFTAQFEIRGTEIQESDPITLDLDDDGFELTTYRQGARFDIEGSGRAVSTAFVNGGDGFLAFDRNRNEVIDSGLELFGGQHGASNGFEQLRHLDSNGDGRIDREDARFEDLSLFIDNGNGRTEPGELLSLAKAGIRSIDLNYRHVNKRAAGGNRIAQIASFLRVDGSRGRAGDAVLKFTV